MIHRATRSTTWVLGCALAATALPSRAGETDWPQWRGAGGEARAAGFVAPATWPKALTQKWKVTVGEGVATPAVVGDRVYVFSRQNNDEVTRALEVATGKEVWADKYATQGVSGPASGFSGPRASPAVADGKEIG